MRHRLRPWGLPKLDEGASSRRVAKVFFGGDAAFGPKNIITAVAHGHEAAVASTASCTANPWPTARRPRST
jgi:formate dehydrogenase beta subunit